MREKQRKEIPGSPGSPDFEPDNDMAPLADSSLPLCHAQTINSVGVNGAPALLRMPARNTPKPKPSVGVMLKPRPLDVEEAPAFHTDASTKYTKAETFSEIVLKPQVR
ncbi:MAG: hypothetical protein Q9159_003836 [Coniocarpon cinnabarinum]